MATFYPFNAELPKKERKKFDPKKERKKIAL